MAVNYDFIGINGIHLTARLPQLRTSGAFRQLESTIESRYDNVIVVIGDRVTAFSNSIGVKDSEETGSDGRTAYIWIDTSTVPVTNAGGQPVTTGQIFVHALAHNATDLPGFLRVTRNVRSQRVPFEPIGARCPRTAP
jgi:hypothetical protein